MSFDEFNGKSVCERCGHYWIARKYINYYQPKSCANCKSKYWNKPRVYQTPQMTAKPFALREKTTWNINILDISPLLPFNEKNTGE